MDGGGGGPTWVLPGILARSARPGYQGERAEPVPKSEVDRWLDEVKALRIGSVICLLDEDHLALYSELPDGLIGTYRRQGLQVAHVPAPDHQTPPLSAAHLERVWQSFLTLPKPVLIHCSAGIDRTGAAVTHIIQNLGRPHPATSQGRG